MRKILFLLIIIFFTSVLNGCNSIERMPFSTMEKTDEESLSFKIEKIILSKGFQSTDPNVEILKNGNSLKLLASLGIVESSGVTIDKITKSGNDINIYIDRLLDKDKTQLAIPQIMIEIQEPIVEKFEDLNFNIINQNYEPIYLKFNRKQILNNIYSQFKVTPNTTPSVILTKPKDKMIWNVYLQNIYDNENHKSPLINLNLKVDAHTGEILDSKKINISNHIDDGYILDYIPNNYILYKKQEMNKENDYETLWVYNIETKEKSKIYTSKNRIQSALFGPRNNYISILEVSDNKSDLYIVPRKDKIAIKITPINFLQPRLMKWKDEDTLYFVNVGENKSTLLSYNIKDNSYNQILSLDFRIEEFDILNGNFAFVQEEKELNNKKIFVTKDGTDLKEIDTGFKASFFDKSTIVYLQHMEKEDKNILHIYNLEDNSIRDLDHNVSNYFLFGKGNIIFVEKNTCNSDFILYKYNVVDDYILPIANIISDKIYYDQANNNGYIALTPPSDSNENTHSVIYSIDLRKLSITK